MLQFWLGDTYDKFFTCTACVTTHEAANLVLTKGCDSQCLSDWESKQQPLFVILPTRNYLNGCLSHIFITAPLTSLPKVYCNGCPSESVWSSKWHVSFASRCLGRRLSTWHMTVALCPKALGTLYGQLTFRLVWCQEHTAVTETELMQPLDLTCGTLFRSSCATQTSAMGCLDDSWRDIFLVNHERGALWLLDMWRFRKTLIYLLTDSVIHYWTILSCILAYTKWLL